MPMPPWSGGLGESKRPGFSNSGVRHRSTGRGHPNGRGAIHGLMFERCSSNQIHRKASICCEATTTATKDEKKQKKYSKTEQHVDMVKIYQECTIAARHQACSIWIIGVQVDSVLLLMIILITASLSSNIFSSALRFRSSIICLVVTSRRAGCTQEMDYKSP